MSLCACVCVCVCIACGPLDALVYRVRAELSRCGASLLLSLSSSSPPHAVPPPTKSLRIRQSRSRVRCASVVGTLCLVTWCGHTLFACLSVLHVVLVSEYYKLCAAPSAFCVCVSSCLCMYSYKFAQLCMTTHSVILTRANPLAPLGTHSFLWHAGQSRPRSGARGRDRQEERGGD